MLTRLATLADAAAVADIYNHEVLTSTSTTDVVPRSLAEQRAWLSERSGAHAVLVAEDDGVIAGFASLSPYRHRHGYRTTVEDSVYVHRDRQGEGVGRLLLEELLDLAVVHGFHAVMARITVGTEASVRLHLACGFEIIGVEREVARKFSRWLDVTLMQRILTPPAPGLRRDAAAAPPGDGAAGGPGRI